MHFHISVDEAHFVVFELFMIIDVQGVIIAATFNLDIIPGRSSDVRVAN
jgi:hypothetical protein